MVEILKFKCEDCPFETEDDYEAEQHTRDTDHCVEEQPEILAE